MDTSQRELIDALRQRLQGRGTHRSVPAAERVVTATPTPSRGARHGDEDRLIVLDADAPERSAAS